MRLLHPTIGDLTDADLLDLYDEPGPHLRAGFASSVDGVVAVDGRAGGLSSPADKAVFSALRGVSDAVVVGAGTARTENYGPVLLSEQVQQWRAAHGRSAQVPLVVVSRTGNLPSQARFLSGPLIIAVPDGVTPTVSAGEVLHANGPAALLSALHSRGFTRLLCEGGPSLLTTLLGAGLLDELCLTTSPQLIGSGPTLTGQLPDGVGLRLRSLVLDDPGVLLARWSVIRSSS